MCARVDATDKGAYYKPIETNNTLEGKTMARKEMIYSVDKKTNMIVRVSKTYLAALQFADDTMYLCTSEFQNLKKGDPMSNVVDFL